MVKLHLGCGKRYFPGWIHIDASHEYEHIIYHDIEHLLFDDNSVDIIYCSHLLEYFDREEVINVLSEWYRVLKPGAILRLAVPDFYEMTNLYLNKKIKIEDILGPLYGKMKLDNTIIYHKTVYDYASLCSILEKIGFKYIRNYDWHETEHANYDDHSQAYLNPKGDKENGTLISLNVEAIK